LFLVFCLIVAYQYLTNQIEISDLISVLALGIALMGLSLGQSAIIFPYQQIFYQAKLNAYIDIYQKARDVHYALTEYLQDNEKQEKFLSTLSKYNETWGKYSFLLPRDVFVALSSYSGIMYEAMPPSEGIEIPVDEQEQDEFFAPYGEPLNDLSYTLKKDLGIEKLSAGVEPLLMAKHKR
jgi:hypothetical protein